MEADSQKDPVPGSGSILAKPQRQNRQRKKPKSSCAKVEEGNVSISDPSAIIGTGFDLEAFLGPSKLEHFLKIFFDRCPPKLLRKFRLVSKLWRDLSLARWRSSDTVRFCAERDEFGGKKLERFLSFVDDKRNEYHSKPFCQFRFEERYISPAGSSLNSHFWRACANDITRLKLVDCTFDGVDGFRKIIYNSCPNLKALTLQNYDLGTEESDSDSEDDALIKQETKYAEPTYEEHAMLRSLTISTDKNELPVSWMELLSHFPNLTALNLSKGVHENGGLKMVLETMQLIRKQDKNKLVLKELTYLPRYEWPDLALHPNDLISIIPDTQISHLHANYQSLRNSG